MNIDSPNRREALLGLLGLPLTAASCTHSSQHLPVGKVVGASASNGHRLRDAATPSVPHDNWEDRAVVIVGGGIAGLAAAWHLKKAGFDDFVVLELESAAGGTSRSGSSPLVDYPWGAHYLPVPLGNNQPLVKLLDEMGLVENVAVDGTPTIAEQFLCRAPQERLFFEGRWYEGLYPWFGASPEDEAQLAAFEREVNAWVGWRDDKGRRAFTIPVADCSDAPEVTRLDRISMDDWLRQRGLVSRRLRWFIEYGCRDDYGLTLRQTSAWAGIFYHAARRSTPTSDSQPFITWPEGNGRLVKHLSAGFQRSIRTGWVVLNIRTDGKASRVNPNLEGAQRLEITAMDVRRNQVRGLRCDQVIFAAPQFVARHVLASHLRGPATHEPDFTYGAWLVANLHLQQRPRDEGTSLAWDNVLYDSPSLGYVVATHQTEIDVGPTVLTYYYPLCDTVPSVARERLLAQDWAAWADFVLSDIEQAHPDIRRLTTRLDVMKWGHAMIQPRIGFMWSERRRKAALPRKGVHFAHSDLSGVALFEEAFYHGVRAAEEVLQARRVNRENGDDVFDL